MRNNLHCLLILALIAGAITSAKAAELSPVLASWLAGQTNIQSWSSDFVQTRRLKSLTQPLTALGHMWFAAPNRFRWELGQPAQTIAVRAPGELLILYPQLKRAEKFPLKAAKAGPWGDALSLLEADFPRSRTELEAQFDIVSQTVADHICQLVLQPKSAAARRMIPRLEIDFDTTDFLLRGTELQFADGSTMRNDFQHAVLNPTLDQQIFDPPIPADYKVVEPLKSR